MTDQEKIEIIPETVLPVLQCHQGAEAGVSVGQLVEEVTGEESTPGLERQMRQVMVELRLKGMPACATPDHGYFWGITAEEVRETARHLSKRSITGLMQASKMSGIGLTTLAGQLELELEAAR
jgi:hypothetical protein